MEIEFPIEFLVSGTPLSLQAKLAASKQEWKQRIQTASRSAIPSPHFVSDKRMAVTLFYLPDERMQGDIDNIVKPILDALCRHIYFDDTQVERVLVQKFEPGNVFSFSQPTTTFVRALEGSKPVPRFRQPCRGFDVIEQTEAEVLQRLVPDLEADGYDVYLHPNRALLPEFFGDYMPDAIARRADKNVAIEVVRKSLKTEPRLAEIARLFHGRDKWELRIVLVTPTTTPQTLEVQSVAAIKKQIDEVRRLAGGKQNGPALLLAWAAFEALARALSATQFERPQTPGRLVQVLARDGYITPTEADRLREHADKRNRFVHGELNVRATKAELEGFARTLENLLKMVGKEHEPAL